MTSKPKMSFFVFVLFPTNISKETEVSIEHDGGIGVRVNILQKKNMVTLDYKESKKLAEYINKMKLEKKGKL